MNATQQGIVTLLRSAITEEALPLPEDFDLETAYPLIRRHHMVTLVYDGAVRCGLPMSSPVMRKLFQDYGKSLLIHERQMREIQRLFAAFDENGIEYMPLKGCKLKALYPKPELRVMTDADILIKLAQYDKIVPIVQSLQFREGEVTDHELIWQKDSLCLELHKRVVPSYNEDFYASYGDGWHLAKLKDGTRYAMTPEDEMVYLFAHFAKHYRDGGIGCRYVVDLWVYRRANPALDEDYVRRELGKLGLLPFYENIRRLMAVWFDGAPSDEKLDFITEFIFASGSWGAVSSRALSQAVRDARHETLGAGAKARYIRQVLFPGVEMLRGKYTILKKAPWMLPVIWLIRPFYKVLFERKSLKRHQRNLNAITPENMLERQQLLNYVGLDYNF